MIRRLFRSAAGWFSLKKWKAASYGIERERERERERTSAQQSKSGRNPRELRLALTLNLGRWARNSIIEAHFLLLWLIAYVPRASSPALYARLQPVAFMIPSAPK